jgi:5'-nucleotidase
VYLATFKLCERAPDLVLSGINRGYNLGDDTFYSGTVAGAREGFFRDASAMAVSVAGSGEATAAVPALHRVLPLLLAAHAAGERHLLNLNVPADGAGAPIRVAPLGRRRYADQVEQRLDLMNQPYYWIGGPPLQVDAREGGDTAVVARGEVALTPLSIDATADRGSWERRLLG